MPAAEKVTRRTSMSCVPSETRRRTGVVLACILCAGLLLRCWGLLWGLPGHDDYHPDEHDYVITHAQTVSFAKPDPGFINYPSFLCYSTAALSGVLRRMGVVREDWQVFLVGRAIVVAYGTLTILAAWALARRLKATTPGALLAALWVAILPLHVWESHIAVTDVMMTFWIVMTLYHSLGLLEAMTWSRCAYVGVCLGLAVGSKYTAAIVALAPLLAMAFAPGAHHRRLAGLAVIGCVSLLCCFAVTPFSFIRFGDLLRAMSYENAHTHGHHLGFSMPADGWQYHRYLYQLAAAWPFSLGLPLFLCAAVGVGWATTQGRRDLGVVLAFAGVFFGVTGSWTFTPLRYYMPVVVLGAILAAVWQGAWIGNPLRSWRFRLACGSIVVALAYTTAFTLSTTRRFADDTRNQADRWFRANLSPPQQVHLFGWHRYTGFLRNDRRFHQHAESSLNHAAGLATNDLIEVTSLHYLRWKRHGNKKGEALYAQLQTIPRAFTCVVKFDAPFLNRDFYGTLDPMFRSYFISPTIEIYRRITDTATMQ